MSHATHLVDHTVSPAVSYEYHEIILNAQSNVSGPALLAAINSELGSSVWQVDTNTQLTDTQVVAAVDSVLGHTDWKFDSEALQDLVGAMLQAGTHTNLTVNYDDATGTINLTASGGGGGGLTQEETEDIVAAMANVTHTGISVLYDDAAGTLKLSLTGETFTTADKNKLAGIAAGATANASDADLRDRSTHTGVQAISTVTGLQTALNGKAATNHTHDDRYYTETEVDTLLSGKADTSHTHAFPVIDLETADLSQHTQRIVESAENGELYWIRADDEPSQMSGCCDSDYSGGGTQPFTLRSTGTDAVYPLVQAGDIILLAQLNHNDNPSEPIAPENAPPTPTGFTSLESSTSVRVGMRLSYKVATGSESGAIAGSASDETHVLVFSSATDPSQWITSIVAHIDQGAPLAVTSITPPVKSHVFTFGGNSELTAISGQDAFTSANAGWIARVEGANLYTWERNADVSTGVNAGSPSTGYASETGENETLIFASVAIPVP